MNDTATKLPWDMPTRERRAYELIAAKPPEERPPLEMLFKKYADLCFHAIADKDAVLERASKTEAQLSLALELLEKADYAIGYVLDVRELKCMHPGRAVDDCCAVCLINKWRVRLDASGLLGEIGGTE